MAVLVSSQQRSGLRGMYATLPCIVQSAIDGAVIGLSMGFAWGFIIRPALKTFFNFGELDLDRLWPAFFGLAIAVSLWVSFRRWQRGTCAPPVPQERGDKST